MTAPTAALKDSAVDAELRRTMGSLLNLLFGVLLGVAIVAAFWLLASFIDDLRHQTHNVRH